MPVTIDTSIDFNNGDVKDFLIDEAREEFAVFDHEIISSAIVATPPSGFTHDPSLDVRVSDAPDTDTYDFLVEEVYRVKQSNGVVGRVPANIHSKARLKIFTDFLLFLREGLNEEGQDHARELLKAYDISVHGRNIYNYLEAQMNTAKLTDDDFDVVPGIRIVKEWQNEVQDWQDQNPGRDPDPWLRLEGYMIDVNDSQRVRLFAQYDDDVETDTQTTVDIITGYDDDGTDWGRPPLGQIITENQISIGRPPKAESRRIVESDTSTNSSVEHEMKEGFDDADARSFIGNLVSAANQDTCPPNEMRRKTIRVMTVLSWPEFKVIWRRKTIKVGCARISFKYPVIQTRTGKRVLYVHFSLPRSLGQTLFRIAETCAIRSALASAVVGIVLANPAAAATSFESLFKACVKRELENCINPGMYMLKERSQWS